jgi:hypothetical protein
LWYYESGISAVEKRVVNRVSGRMVQAERPSARSATSRIELPGAYISGMMSTSQLRGSWSVVSNSSNHLNLLIPTQKQPRFISLDELSAFYIDEDKINKAQRVGMLFPTSPVT